MRILFLICLFCLSGLLYSQDKSTEATSPKNISTVILKNRKTFRGHIVENNDKIVRLKTDTGLYIQIDTDNISKIVTDTMEIKYVKIANFNNHISSIRVFSQFGENYYGANSMGYGIHLAHDMRILRGLYAGLGAGVDKYIPKEINGHFSYPIYLEALWHAGNEKRGYFVKLNGGYGFPGAYPENDLYSWKTIDKLQGGWMYQIGTGFRMSEQINIEIGYKQQNAQYTWSSESARSSGVDNIVYRRWIFGLHFNL
jgi:hypothetical protein